MSRTESIGPARAARDWALALKPYRQADTGRATLELLVTFPPFAALWGAMVMASSHGLFWLSFALAPFAAGLLVRLFMIQHDCGHGAFFPNKQANEWVGRAIGVLTMTPYDLWRRSHAIHHATSGNLDRRGIGDIDTLTVREYFARPWREPARLSALPPSSGDVRHWPRLCLPDREPPAARLHAQGRDALAQHDVDQRRNSAGGRASDLGRRALRRS